MTFSPRAFFWTAVGAGLLILGLSLYARTMLPAAPLGRATPQARMSPAQVTARYSAALTQAAATLGPILQNIVTAADVPTLEQVRASLVVLTVPASAQSYHLQLVLVLTRLIGTVQAPAGGVRVASAATMSVPQRQLMQLLAKTPSFK